MKKPWPPVQWKICLPVKLATNCFNDKNTLTSRPVRGLDWPALENGHEQWHVCTLILIIIIIKTTSLPNTN